MDAINCVKCGKPRHPRLFRHKIVVRRGDGSAHMVGRMTSECRYCYERRLSIGGEFLLAQRAKQGKIDFVLADARRQRREVKRREKLSRVVKARWDKERRANVNAHPLTLELRRVKAVLDHINKARGTATTPTLAAKKFFASYYQSLSDMYWRMRDNPALSYQRSSQSLPFRKQLAEMQDEVRRAWVCLTPTDRGLFAPPQRITNA